MQLFPLLQSQEGVFVECMVDPNTTRYNIPFLTKFSKNVCLQKFENALLSIISTRAEMHTRFAINENGMPCQWIDRDLQININHSKISDSEIDRYIHEKFVRPFDILNGEPLWRFEIVEGDSYNYFLADVHHLIGDGTTLAPCFSMLDLPMAYEGKPLEVKTYGMIEHALNEQESFKSDAYQQAKLHNEKKFADIDFATIQPVPVTHVGRLIRDSFYINAEEVDTWCKEQGTSSNLLFMAAFSYVFSECLREEKVAYHTLNHGRTDRRLREGVYGMFVKSVPILADVTRNQKVLDFIKGFKRELMQTIRYGVYPFSHLCRDLKKKPGVEFSFQGVTMQEYSILDGERVEAKQIPCGLSASNMSCVIYLVNGNYDIRMTSSEAINSHDVLKAVGQAILGTVQNMMQHPDALLSEISMLTEDEKKRVESLRITAQAEVPQKLFFEPVEKNAIEIPNTMALIAKDRSLTFAEFNAEANRVAHALIERGVERGDRVMLLLPRTSAVIVSMFGISKTGAAYIPCDPEYPADRINLIINDSEAQYIITTKSHMTDYPTDKVIDIDNIYMNPAYGTDNPNVGVSPDDLAYMIYTSGSTGRPKGVMLRHRGISNYLYNHPANVHIDGLKRLDVKTFVSITTLSFDMSLKEFAGSLFNGITTVLADEQEILDPIALAQLMKRTKAEAINGTCSRIQSYMELPELCEALRNCKMVWSGGEMYPQSLLKSLQALGVEIINTYGPTEITVSSNIKNLTHSDKVTVGRPLLNYVEYVVDQWGNEMPVGITGELLIGGPGVARGYNNLPEMTQQRFVEYKGERVYRSGDLARWTEDGDIEILGRIDSQVKLRGFRIELEEIENKALEYEGLRKAVADVKDIGATQHLCLYYTSDDEIDQNSLKAFLAESLTDYMVPSAYMRIEVVPLTPNGKTNRKALPAPTLQLDDIVAPANEQEDAVLKVISKLLQVNDFGVTNNLVSLGLTSLLAMRLSAMLQKEIGINIRMHEILQAPTIRDIVRNASEQVTVLTPHPMQEFYPISESQRGMCVDCMMNPDALQYNIPFVLHFIDVDVKKIVASFSQIINAHPYMKVRLMMKDGDIVQHRDDNREPIDIKVEILTEMPDRQFFQSRIHSFNILNEELYRISVYTYGNHVFILTDLHHLIADGSSNVVLARNLEQAYAGHSLQTETYTAYDRTLDEEALMQSDRAKETEQYFDTMLTGMSSTVYPHSAKRDKGTHKQGMIDIHLEGTAINEYCKKYALLHNGFFMAVFNQVLHRMTREDDILTYFISNGRSELQLDDFFGVFVKTMPCVCSKWDGTMTDAVLMLNKQMQETIKNDFYPFSTMVERHGLSANIIFNYVANFQHDVVLEGSKALERYTLDWDTSKNPMSLSIFGDANGDYTVNVEYDADLYSHADMLALAKAYATFASKCVLPEYHNLCDIPLLSDEEAKEVETLAQGDILTYDYEETFVSLFLRQAKERPNAMAVVDKTGNYSYAELDDLSNAIAHKLIDMTDSQAQSPFISIMLGYQKEFLIAAIAIERAGMAYVPLDYEYPKERQLYMLSDSESQVLITSHEIFNEKIAEGDDFTDKNILFIDDFLGNIEYSKAALSSIEPINMAKPTGLAYMIYTSGSTGKPKGVMIPHRAKINFVHFIAKEWRLTDKSRICCHSSFSFDASIEDLYPVLTVGGTLYIVPMEARKDLDMLYHFICDNGITGGCYTTQLGQMLLQNYDIPVDYLVVGGEKMTANPDCKARLINTYGPTEFTVDATFFETKKGKEYKNIPIGRPLYNLAAYVIDQYGNLLPQGVAGELCMAGRQMAAGYWRREELTAEKFCKAKFLNNPYFEDPYSAGYANKIYHTGDLVRYNKDGQIEYLGRIDSQVKLRGFRIELGEIETLIAGYEGIDMVSVQVKEIGGVQHLVAYYSAGVDIAKDELRAYLSEQLTEYMVPTVYMQLDVMPLTPNGKVNSKALPLPIVTVEKEDSVAPATKTEKKVFEITASLLKNDDFGVTTNLLNMGLTSLSAMRFSISIKEKLNINIPVKDILSHPTVRQLSDLIDIYSEMSAQTTASDDLSAIWPHNERYYSPVTENQRGLLIDCEMNPETTQYNVPDVYVFEGIDGETLRKALIKVVDAHPYLKTRFAMHEGEIVQLRRDAEPIEVTLSKLDNTPTTEFFQSRVLPFDLNKDNLYRIEVYTFENDSYLFLDIHHTVFDGASSIFFINDLKKVLSGEKLSRESYTYFDHSFEELKQMHGPAYSEAEQYFDRLLGDIETTIYPYSSNSSVPQGTSRRISRKFSCDNVTAFCKKEGVTANNYYATVLAQLLHRVTREERVSFTTINNGRNDARKFGIIGMFVKTIPVVSKADYSSTMATAVKTIQKQSVEILSRDFYPYTHMVERHKLKTEILFAYQAVAESMNTQMEEKKYTLELGTTKMPLDISVIALNDNTNTLLVEYDASRYTEANINLFADMFCHLTDSLATTNNISFATLLTPEQETEALILGTGKKLDYDRKKTFIQLFVEQAEKNPNAIAVVDKDGQHTYGELNKQSDNLAHFLINSGIKADSFVDVLVNRSIHFPLSVLAIHKAGAAYTPLDIDYPVERLQYMLEDSGAKVLLTSHDVIDAKISQDGLTIDDNQVKVIYLDELFLEDCDTPIDRSTPDSLAYMIYTSGSTGKPKGVMLHQRGLLNFIHSLVDAERLSYADKVAAHRSFSFDAHIGDFYPILAVGGEMHIMPSEIRKDLDAIHQYLVDHKISVFGCTTSLMTLLLNNYDLPLRCATAGGEKLIGVSSETITIINEYGPTECTNDSTLYILEPGQKADDIPVGRPLPNTQSLILDPTGNLLPQGIAGELCIAGVQVGRGYWNLPEQTAKAFVTSRYVNGPLYKTGDLARYNNDGQIEYLGRIDDQVKLRGFRIEIGEIESCAHSHEAIKQVAAAVKEVNGSHSLILYYSLREGMVLSENEFREFINSTSLATYMHPDIYMYLDEMPLLPNGKINRKALPQPQISEREFVEAASDNEKIIAEIVCKNLKIEKVSATANLISLGMTSLSIMSLVMQINKAVGSHLKVKEVIKDPTIRAMAVLLDDNNEKTIVTQMIDYSKRDYYPITENQRGIYIDWEMNRNTTQYNIPTLYKFKTEVDVVKLADTVRTVLSAHPYLNAHFTMQDNDVMQLRNDELAPVVTIAELDEEPTKDFFQNLVRPFNLFEDCLYHVSIYKSPKAAWLFMDVHHTIFDGGSEYIFIQQLIEAYEGNAIEKENYTAFERALDEQALVQTQEYAEAKQYFDNLLEDIETTTYPHSTQPDSQEALSGTVLQIVDAHAIREFCQENAVTANNYFLSVLMQTMHRLTREKKVIVSTVSNGRSDDRMMDIVGMFVKTIPMVSILTEKSSTEVSFVDLVKRQQQQFNDTTARDFYPFTAMVQQHGIRPNIMYAYGNGIDSNTDTDTRTLAKYENIDLTLDVAKAPIIFQVSSDIEHFHIALEYDKSLYSKNDMEQLLNILATYAINAPLQKNDLRRIPLVNKEEALKLVNLSCGGHLDYDVNTTFIDMVLANAERQPSAIALVDEAGSYTYAELDRHSNTIAHALIKQGAKQGVFVGIMLPRTKEFMTSVVAVQRCGAAYVPMDREYPIDRLLYMLSDSAASTLITTHKLFEEKKKEGEFNVNNIIFIEDYQNAPIAHSELKSLNNTTPDGLAYMIYTSGSTGLPKGVMLPHKALRAFIAWRLEKIGITAASRHAAHASFSFDASLDDLICPLAAGGRVYILPESLRKDLDGMYEYFKANNITGLTLSTALGMSMLSAHSDLSIKFLMMGGEKMLPCDKTDVKIINGYGPTEFSVCSSFHIVDQSKDIDIPIGRPVPNSYSLICDMYGNLMPQGFVGELYLAGIQIAKGYWNREDLTEEKFCKNQSLEPYSPDGTLNSDLPKRMYRTGDLAYYNEEGELVFMGRIDNQVKLRGFRIELGEIENRASSFDGIKAVAAEVKELHGGKHLVLYYTAETTIDEDALRSHLAESLTEYMVPEIYMALEEMPLTPNGKVNRKILPEPVLKSNVEYVEPANKTEHIIADAFQSVLNISEPVGALDSFFALGGDSIKSIRLASVLRQEGLVLQVAQIMKLKTVRALAEAASTTQISISQEAWDGIVEDSAIVRFFFDLELPKPEHFNQSILLQAKESVDIQALQKAAEALWKQHDMLRAHIIDSHLEVLPESTDCIVAEYSYDSLGQAQKKIDELQSTINFITGPLFSINVLHLTDYDAIAIVCHHSIVDGVSWRILLSDFNKAYSQAVIGDVVSLPKKTHSYRDFCDAVKAYSNSAALQQEIIFWQNIQQRLEVLPTSNAKNHIRRQGKLEISLDAKNTTLLTTEANKAYNTEINDLLMAALARAYKDTTGQSSISVQFEGHGRENIGEELYLDRTVGWFTSIYPIVIDTTKDINHDIIEAKETMHNIPNKGVGYNILRFVADNRKKLGLSTDKVPMIGFNYLGQMDSEQQSTDAVFIMPTELSIGEDFASENKFGPDLSINSSITNGELKVTLDYNVDVMDSETASVFINSFIDELKQIVKHTIEQTEQTVTASDLGETEWSTADFESVYAKFKSNGITLQRIYPLTPMQEGILLKFISDPKTVAYRLVSAMNVNILPTKDQLRYALDMLGTKHEVLRTCLICNDVDPYRQAITNRPLALEMADISDTEDKNAALMKLYKAEQTKPLDMENTPLFNIICAKTSDTTCSLIISVHHIIIDGWCIQLYTSDLMRYLTEAMAGVTSELDNSNDGKYEEYVRGIYSKNMDQAEAYWRKLLDGFTEKSVIPSYGILPKNERCDDNVVTTVLLGDDLVKLRKLAIDENATMNNLVELAWGLTLQFYNHSNDSLFVKVVSGRNHSEADMSSVLGLFINSVPVRVVSDVDLTLRQMLTNIQQQAAESSEWDFYPLAGMQQMTELGGDLYQSVFAYENYNSSSEEQRQGAAPFNCEVVYSKEESFNDITITAYDEADKLTINIEFDNSRYRREYINEVANIIAKVLHVTATAPNSKAQQACVISEEAEAALYALGAGERLNVDSSLTLVDIFTRQALATPDSVCVVYKNNSYTYREIDNLSTQLAVYLQQHYGIKQETVVGVMVERSEWMIIYPLAVMKAGGAYMPLDFHFPADRLSYMCDDANVRLILSEDNRVSEAIPGYNVDVMTTAEVLSLPVTSRSLDVSCKAKPDNMFIILYTSGSTGKPKGVMLEHRNIVNFCHWYCKEFDVTAKDRAVAYANFGFDAHMMDIYPSITCGASVYVIASEMRMDLMGMNEYMEENDLSIAFMTTQVGYMFATTIDNNSLRLLSVGGEKLKPLAKPNFRFYNGYGPTECTLYSTYYNIEKDYDSSLIGRPLANYQLYVVNNYMQLVPRGASGELVVAGVGVGRGYLNRPDINAEKFITFDGKPAYRTGDLVRWSEDGNIEFLGRIDNQVKLRGLRIEMGEIESCVEQYIGIDMCAVDVKDINGNPQICCYYTAKNVINLENLRKFLQEKLADYMVPSCYMQLDSLPLTPNGKVNRKALPVPETVITTENIPPQTEKEKILFEIAKTLLKTDRFGITDDLTRLGLTSILGIRFVVMAQKKGITLKVNDLMKQRSISNVLKKSMSIGFWDNEYKADKPIIVVTCGATPYKNMEPLITSLHDRYSVYVLEPITEHYKYIFDGEDVNEVVEMYYTMLDLFVDMKKIAAFVGHCFGGELSYRLAEHWQRDYDSPMPVLLLDVFWRETPAQRIAERMRELIPENVMEKYREQIESEITAMAMYDNLSRQGKPVIFEGAKALFRSTKEEIDNPVKAAIKAMLSQEALDAWHEMTNDRDMNNAEFWRSYYPDIEVYDTTGDHLSMLNCKYVDRYVEWIDEQANTNNNK